MSKISLLFLVVFGVLLLGMSAMACNFRFFHKSQSQKSVKCTEFEILPTMDTESNAKNQVWVGTLQLVWNDLIDEVIHHPIEFVGGKSVAAENLNKREFSADDLNDSSYYKKVGLVSEDLKKEIEKAIKKKFNETSDVLGSVDWTPEPEKYLLYAILKKDFEYIQPFSKMPDGKFNGSDGNVKFFGINNESDSSLRNTVTVLFYNGADDFAVSLKSKQGDTVYLYRTDDVKTLDKLYKDMKDKQNSYEGKKWLTKKDEFKAPMLDFKREKSFKELCRVIKNSPFMITQALETIQFKMDEVGVKLKSEAVIVVALTSALPDREEPRYFNFDSRYVIFLEEKDKPYFGMKIEDVKPLQ
ncbi:MAG: hypothetical protein K6E29_03020 [Cyanobacteria bacterium RUI128]|nr:hypothetical protein [Cyanobacteria bacterium RUI128]